MLALLRTWLTSLTWPSLAAIFFLNNHFSKPAVLNAVLVGVALGGGHRRRRRRCRRPPPPTIFNSCTAQRSSVALFPWWLIVLSARVPQLQKESTTCILCHINAVTVKSHLLVLVVEDITKGILVKSDLKMDKTSFLWWTSLHYQQHHEGILQRLHSLLKSRIGSLME